MAENSRVKIGYLIGGGLKESFSVRLTVSPQDVQEGTFVVMKSGIWNYYGIVTDINFVIGYTREQGHPVCINLDKFVQRSAGVFGATGTGKSFLTRIVLAGLMHHNRASVLVFDMHNEYGYDDTASDTGLRVTGLKTKFASRCAWSAWAPAPPSAAPTRISTWRSPWATSPPPTSNCSPAN
jgi:hypothetical protein